MVPGREEIRNEEPRGSSRLKLFTRNRALPVFTHYHREDWPFIAVYGAMNKRVYYYAAAHTAEFARTPFFLAVRARAHSERAPRGAEIITITSHARNRFSKFTRYFITTALAAKRRNSALASLISIREIANQSLSCFGDKNLYSCIIPQLCSPFYSRRAFSAGYGRAILVPLCVHRSNVSFHVGIYAHTLFLYVGEIIATFL